MTNPGDYIWNLNYGGGLAQFVGIPTNATDIEAVVRAQLALESSVPADPEPQVQVNVNNSVNGSVVAKITYADPATSAPISLNVAAGS